MDNNKILISALAVLIIFEIINTFVLYVMIKRLELRIKKIETDKLMEGAFSIVKQHREAKHFYDEELKRRKSKEELTNLF